MELAGVVPARRICSELRRSRSSVTTKASRLGLNLRVYEKLTVICPKCGEARAKSGSWTGRTGFCEVCRMRDSYAEAKWAQAEAYAALDPRQRSVYDATEAKVGRSRLPPKPPAPSTAGLDPYRRARAEDLHAMDVERWEKKCLKLLTDACKQRTKRMREKSGTNPRKNRETNAKFDVDPDRKDDR